MAPPFSGALDQTCLATSVAIADAAATTHTAKWPGILASMPWVIVAFGEVWDTPSVGPRTLTSGIGLTAPWARAWVAWAIPGQARHGSCPRAPRRWPGSGPARRLEARG